MLRIVGGQARGCRLERPSSAAVRPAPDRLRESLFAILKSHLAGIRVADLFAGSGVLGLEALSRGASHCTFVDRDREVIATIRRNIASVGFTGRCAVVEQDVAAGVKLPRPAELVFLDPPFALFRDTEGKVLLAELLSDVVDRLTAPDGIVVLRYEGKAEAEACALLEPWRDRVWLDRTYGRSRVKALHLESPGHTIG